MQSICNRAARLMMNVAIMLGVLAAMSHLTANAEPTPKIGNPPVCTNVQQPCYIDLSQPTTCPGCSTGSQGNICGFLVNPGPPRACDACQQPCNCVKNGIIWTCN
jgi:hypothetical protein